MKKGRINAIVDLAALIVFVPSVISGIVLLVALPVGSPLRSMYIGVTRFQWLRMHDVTSIALATLIVLHITLHWKFYRKIVGLEKKKTEPDTPEW